jgi:4-hydroxythreonine-4-phosphate dehydrogenase
VKKIAVSAGDLNGIGIELALRFHNEAKKLANLIYSIDEKMLEQAAKLLRIDTSADFECIAPEADRFEIHPGTVDAAAGACSFASFAKAVELVRHKTADAVCTLPIHKKAWQKAGISYRGHTDALRDIFGKEAIMMLGCPQMYVGLFTEHIPLKEVPAKIERESLTRFLLDFQHETKAEKIAVLGLNPHAGDNGVLGDEERIIEAAVKSANDYAASRERGGEDIFEGPFVPDIAFTPAVRSRFTYFAAMYHDQGLIPLKALHFDESINVSLNLPILRTSVDHGTAFDIAYKNANPKGTSYLNAIRYAAEF